MNRAVGGSYLQVRTEIIVQNIDSQRTNGLLTRLYRQKSLIADRCPGCIRENPSIGESHTAQIQSSRLLDCNAELQGVSQCRSTGGAVALLSHLGTPS